MTTAERRKGWRISAFAGSSGIGLNFRKILTAASPHPPLCPGLNTKSLIEIAVQTAEAGEHDDALLWWRKVIDINPDGSVVFYNMVILFSAQ